MIKLNLKQSKTAREFYRAINNDVRANVLQHLEKTGECTVNQLVEHCSIDQPQMSTHLRLLRKFKLVSTRHEGKSIYYSTNTQAVEVANNAANNISEFLNSK